MNTNDKQNETSLFFTPPEEGTDLDTPIGKAEQPRGIVSWVILVLLSWIPIINIFFLILWGFLRNDDKERSHYCISVLILSIGVFLVLAFLQIHPTRSDSQIENETTLEESSIQEEESSAASSFASVSKEEESSMESSVPSEPAESTESSELAEPSEHAESSESAESSLSGKYLKNVSLNNGISSTEVLVPASSGMEKKDNSCSAAVSGIRLTVSFSSSEVLSENDLISALSEDIEGYINVYATSPDYYSDIERQPVLQIEDGSYVQEIACKYNVLGEKYDYWLFVLTSNRDGYLLTTEIEISEYESQDNSNEILSEVSSYYDITLPTLDSTSPRLRG